MSLSNKYYLAALLDARGATTSEIAETLSITPPTVYSLRQKPEYKLQVEKFKRELVDRAIDRSAELLAMFDEEALPAFKTLQNVHRNTMERGTVRVAAALGLLERSSVAPRRRSDDATAFATKVVLGKVALDRIKTAFTDIGEEDAIDLADSDYTSETRNSIPEGEIKPTEAP